MFLLYRPRISKLQTWRKAIEKSCASHSAQSTCRIELLYLKSAFQILARRSISSFYSVFADKCCDTTWNKATVTSIKMLLQLCFTFFQNIEPWYIVSGQTVKWANTNYLLKISSANGMLFLLAREVQIYCLLLSSDGTVFIQSFVEVTLTHTHTHTHIRTHAPTPSVAHTNTPGAFIRKPIAF